MIFKIIFRKEIHIVIQDVPNFEELMKNIKCSYTRLPDFFSIIYVNEEGDKMTINGQNDMQALFYIDNQTNTILLQIEDLMQQMSMMTLEEPQKVTGAQQKSQAIQIENPQPMGQSQTQSDVHEGVICHGCQIESIYGARFKCTQCQNFDLCASCHDFMQHEHPLAEIKSQAQAHQSMSPGNKPYEIGGVELSREQYYSMMGYSSPSSNNGKTAEETILEHATYIQRLFNIQFDQALGFVEQNPKLDREDLVQLYLDLQKM